MTEIPEGFLEEMRHLLGCDVVRISQPLDRMFLIQGFNRNTREDPGMWVDENGVEKHWDYVHEQVIANGSTIEELRESTVHYAGLIRREKSNTSDPE